MVFPLFVSCFFSNSSSHSWGEAGHITHGVMLESWVELQGIFKVQLGVKI
jgi:hypothetical protein